MYLEDLEHSRTEREGSFLTAGNRRDGAATSQKSVAISENRETTKTRHGSRKQEEAVEENQPLPTAGAPNPR